MANRYSKEITYDREVNGVTKKAQTIRFLDRTYDINKVTVHIVSDGETLFSIADKYYDDFRKWYLIAEKNPLVINPFKLQIGSELIVPDI